MKRCERIAHRCNDPGRLKAAAKDGYRYAELDVMQTKDGVIVVRHNHKDGEGRRISQLDYDVSMGSTLDEMVQLANDLKLGLFVEMKDVEAEKPPQYEHNVMACLTKAEWPYVIITFSQRVVIQLYQMPERPDVIISSLDGKFPLADENIDRMCKGVAIPYAKLNTTNGHNHSMFVFHVEGNIPENLQSGISGVIK